MRWCSVFLLSYSVDPFSKKDWYDIKAPSVFSVRNIGKTLVSRTQGTRVCFSFVLVFSYFPNVMVVWTCAYIVSVFLSLKMKFFACRLYVKKGMFWPVSEMFRRQMLYFLSSCIVWYSRWSKNRSFYFCSKWKFSNSERVFVETCAYIYTIK